MMTKLDAIVAIASGCGGQVLRPSVQDGSSPTFRFPSLDAADRCKAILDALLPPGHTGKVVGSGLLVVAVPDMAPWARS